MTELSEVARGLYALPPGDFVVARNRAARAARAAGDRSLADAVKELRRPATAAWAVNLLVRERAALLTQVVEMGEALRQAQSLLQGDALRDLVKQRRQLVAAVAGEAGALAAAGGAGLSEAAVRQVEETLQAAMTDRSAAAAVRSGLLVAPLLSTGLEALAEALAVPGGAGESVGEAGGAGGAGPPVLRVVEDDDRPRREAEERVASAGAALRKAVKGRDKAVKRHGKVQARVLQLEAELEELRREVAGLEDRAEAAAAELAEAEEAVTARDGHVASARRTAAEAAAALAALD